MSQLWLAAEPGLFVCPWRQSRRRNLRLERNIESGARHTQKKEVNELATVELKSGESQERLLKRFRKKVQKSRILSTVKKKRYFMSKSEKRRLALRKAKRRERRRRWRRQRKNRY